MVGHSDINSLGPYMVGIVTLTNLDCVWYIGYSDVNKPGLCMVGYSDVNKPGLGV